MTNNDTLDFDFDTVQAQPSITVPQDYDPKPDTPRCSECDTPLVYSGKGRRPTKCDAHKKNRSNSANAPRRISGRSSKSSQVDYRPGILGLFQIPAGALAFAGMSKPVFAADAACVSIYSPGIADALNELAKERPEVAAVLDKVLSVGPYGLLIAAVTPMILQICVNHGILPAGIMGTVPQEALLAHLAEQTRAQEEALKAAMAS